MLKFGRSGLVEAEIMDLGVFLTDGAQGASRRVSNKMTNAAVNPSTIVQMEQGLADRLINDFGYDANAFIRNPPDNDTFATERTKTDTKGKAIIAMNAVTDADPGRYLERFANQFKRITFNEADGTVILTTFLVTRDGIFAVRTTLKAQNLAEAQKAILVASPEAKEFAEKRAAEATASNQIDTSPGGIDLSPLYGIVDLQIQRDEDGIPLPLQTQPMGTMRIEGFSPVITRMTQITAANLPPIFGSRKKEPAKGLSLLKDGP